jgi:hypothetical protein
MRLKKEGKIYIDPEGKEREKAKDSLRERKNHENTFGV